jgi:hypothetical protein
MGAVRSLFGFSFIIYSLSCQGPDTAKPLPPVGGFVSVEKKNLVSNVTQAKRLNELSEIERMEFVNDTFSSLTTRELLEIVKENCYENKEIEEKPNCFNLRKQCANSIQAEADSYLSVFIEKAEKIKSCLNEQFNHSDLSTENIVDNFGFIIDFMSTVHEELDCPASFEQYGIIFDKVVANYGGREALEELMTDDADKLFYPCLNRYIFR